MDGFEHLGLLVHFGEKGAGESHLSQYAPFFANSDPDMPAVPVPAAQVHEWIVQNIASTLEHISERNIPKDNGPTNVSDPDVAMTDACPSSVKASTSARSPSFIEGVSKTSLVKQASDFKGSSVKVCFLCLRYVPLVKPNDIVFICMFALLIISFIIFVEE